MSFPRFDPFSRISPLRISALFCCVLMAVSAGRPVSAQAPAEQPHTSTLTVKARLVVLDLVVRDKHGNVVTDLTQDDFRVYEDNQPQRIRSFEAPSAHMLPAATTAETVFDPAEPANFGQSPVTVLVLDQLNTQFADSSFARRSLRDYLTRQPALLAQPATLLVVADQSFHSIQGFTRDRDLLLKTLAAAPTKYGWNLEINKNAGYGPIERLDQTLRALENISQAYARVPGRKNLVWVGGGFPSLDPTTLDNKDAAEVHATLQHVTDSLLASRITVYAVDPTTSAAGMSEITSEEQQAFADAAGETILRGTDPFASSDDFDRLGPLTGGRVLRGMNDVAQQIASSVDLGANFYTLSYAPTNANESAAKFRKIRVDCLRPGLTINTRDGYYAEPTQPQASTDAVAYDLATAADSKVPLNGLHLTASPATTVSAPPGSYVVHVAAPGLDWKRQEDGTSIASVYVMAAEYSAKDKMLSHVDHPMTATARPNVDLREEQRTADFIITPPAAPRSTRLRFVVRDSATGRMGSIDLPIPAH